MIGVNPDLVSKENVSKVLEGFGYLEDFFVGDGIVELKTRPFLNEEGN